MLQDILFWDIIKKNKLRNQIGPQFILYLQIYSTNIYEKAKFWKHIYYNNEYML